MARKSFTVLMVVCLLLAATVVPAFAKPEPPAPMGSTSAAPGIDMANAPEAVKAAASLKASTSAEQQAAVNAVFDKYLPEIDSITTALTAGTKAGSQDVQRMDPVIAQRLKDVHAAIEADIMAVLTPEQQAMFQAVLHPSTGIEMTKVNTVNAPDSYTSNCWYAAYYDAYGIYYGYYSYLYAYYNYYYSSSSSSGGSYKYTAYYDSYYGYIYAKYALDYAGPLYFSLYYTSSYWSGYPYNSYYWGYQAYYYAYYGYYYSYLNYNASGAYYPYYAYVYGNYARTYTYNGYYYGYYCYYYA